MARPVFSPPPDDDDVIDVLAGRAPIYRPSPPKTDAPVPQPPPSEPASPKGTAPVSREPVSTPAVGKRSTPTREAGPLPASTKPQRRVGLYLDLEQWARLNEVQIERARRSLPHDYTAIVLEALEAHYGKFERRRS